MITILLIVGISESATFNNIIVFIKITMVLLFIAFGFTYINRENWEPFIPPADGRRASTAGSGVVRGAAVIFFAYIGFDAVSTAAQETKNPQRDMPIGILGSLAICTVLYIAVALVLTGIVKYTELNVPDPIAVGINAAGPALAWLRPVREDRRDRGTLVGHPGDAPGPAAHLLLDGEGRAAAAGLQRRCTRGSARPSSPALVTGVVRHGVRRLLPDRPPRRARLDRHPARVRDRLRRRARPAATPIPTGRAVPDAARARSSRSAAS